MDIDAIEFNEFQTPIDEKVLKAYPEEVIEELLEFVNTVPIINWLVSKNRPRAKDLPRDVNGRIIVDVTHPHIIEDADYFCQPALYYKQHHKYTHLKPNSNPHSEYRKHWDEELRRTREGYVRPSDGEWITGYMYWFMNYNPMMVNIISSNSTAVRQEGFPFFFEGIYLRFHYLEQARLQGKHAIELAKRGCAKAHTYDEKVFTPKGWVKWGSIKKGDILYNPDGGITKVIDIPFDGNAECYRIFLDDGRSVTASDEHLWVVSDGKDNNEFLITTSALYNNYSTNEYYLKNAECVEFNTKKTLIDPYIFGSLLIGGNFSSDTCTYIQNNAVLKEQMCLFNTDIKQTDKPYVYEIGLDLWPKAIRKYGLHNTSRNKRFIPYEFKVNSKEARIQLLRGIFDAGGIIHSMTGETYVQVLSKKLAGDILFVARSLGYKARYYVSTIKHRDNKTYHKFYKVYVYAGNDIFSIKSKKSKVLNTNTNNNNLSKIKYIKPLGVLPCKCVTVSADNSMYLIADFIPTHNSYTLSSMMTRNLFFGYSKEANHRVTTTLLASAKEFLKDDKDGTLSKFKPSLNFIRTNTPYPNLLLKNSSAEMSWQMGYKDEEGIERGSFNTVLALSAEDDADKVRGKRGDFYIEEMGAFSGLLALYDTLRKGVEDGNYTFGLIYLVGTSNEKEADFSSAKTLLYSPEAYNIYAVDNVYDKKSIANGKFGFFYGAYLNRAGCYNKDGVSDVIKALLQILMARYNAKKNSADPTSVLRIISEDPITPAEAILKAKVSYFPTAQLAERKAQLEKDPRAFDDVAVGDLVFRNGSVVFVPTNDIPIREYGVSNDTPGALEIYAFPEKGPDGKVMPERYIIGTDPVDNDVADSKSLSSRFVLDLYTDSIVAEYTGRKQFADEAYEMDRKLCIFYNAKDMFEQNLKGTFAYFQRMNSLHLLADTPQYLKDKQLTKVSSFGNSSKGVRTTAAIKNFGMQLLKDWICAPIEVTDTEGNTVIMPRLYTLRNIALIDEMIQYTPELNVDRIMAMVMLMIYREEKMILYQGDFRKARDNRIQKPEDDEFFFDNYDRRFAND